MKKHHRIENRLRWIDQEVAAIREALAKATLAPEQEESMEQELTKIYNSLDDILFDLENTEE